MQLAWIVALPPFRGSDESDQAFRMASVARGEWHADYKTRVQARGNIVTVPKELIRAATPECSWYKYQSWDNCHVVRRVGGHYGTVASSAARYNPVFYWVVGIPARLLGGASSLLAMRLSASVLCSLMLAGIGLTVAQWARSAWPWIGCAVAMTPVVVYSTVLPAPNAVEMLGGLGLWTALLGLTRVNGDPLHERRLVWASVPFAVCLVGVRALGPLWLALIVCSFTAFVGYGRVWQLLRNNARTWGAATTVIVLAGIAAVGWTFSQGTDSLAHADNPYREMWRVLAWQPFLWVLQSIAAFPTRDEPAPPVVYALALIIFLALLGAGLLRSPRRLRMAIVAVSVLSLLVPLVISIVIYPHSGLAWQGRYTLPYSMGVPVLAALGLDLRGWRPRHPVLVWLASISVMVVAYSTGIGHVLQQERAHSPLAGTSEWWIPPLWLVVGLTATGLLCWGYATRYFRAETRELTTPAPPGHSETSAVLGSADAANHRT